MAHALLNFGSSLPVLSKKNKQHSSNLLQKYSYQAGGIPKRCSVKAVGGDGNGVNVGSLDHLQRQSEKQLRQSEKQSQRLTRRTSPRVAAPIGLWDRFSTARTLQQMMDTMDRLIDDPVSLNSGTWQSPTSRYSQGRTPWEIQEAEKEYRMRFDMPGMTKQDVKVYLEEKMLVVKAEKRDEGGETEKESEDEWPAKSYGKYSTRIALPENVDFEKIKAEVRDGVLYITVPKASGGSKIFDINVE